MGTEPDPTPCADCGFDWSISGGAAIGLVGSAPGRYSLLLANGVGPTSDDPKHWSATGYLWHVVDVIRLGTERLWALTLDASSGVPGWDEEALAEVRRYEQLSAAVGLRALAAAVDEWVVAARGAPQTVDVAHPVFGKMTTHDSILRNAHEVQHHARDIERALLGDP